MSQNDRFETLIEETAMEIKAPSREAGRLL